MDGLTLEIFIKDLSSDFKADSYFNESVFREVEQLYNENKRPDYTVITQFVFHIEQVSGDDRDERIEMLSMNLSEARDSSIFENTDHLREYVNKLLNHLNLAIEQKSYIDATLKETQKKAQYLEEKSAEIDKKLKELEATNKKVSVAANASMKQVKSIQNLKAKIYAEFVTILGIFATIIFAAFGGLEMLKNVLGNIEEVRIAKLLIFSSLTIAGIILMLFMLLNAMARMTGLNLRSCNCGYEDQCNHNMFQKHPTVMLANLVLSYMFIVGVTTYVFDFKKVQDLVSTKNNTFVEPIILIFILVLVPITLIIYFRIKVGKNQTRNETETSGIDLATNNKTKKMKKRWFGRKRKSRI